MSKVLLVLAFLFLIIFPNQVAASHKCADSIYDGSKASVITSNQCLTDWCEEDRRCSGGRCELTCWPPKDSIKCTDAIERVEPLNPNANEEVKLFFRPHNDQYSVSILNSTSSTPTRVPKGMVAPNQIEFSLGSFSRNAHITVIVSLDTISGSVACNGPTFYSFNVAGGSGVVTSATCTAQKLSDSQFSFKASGLNPIRTYKLWQPLDRGSFPITPAEDGTAESIIDFSGTSTTTFNRWALRDSFDGAGGTVACRPRDITSTSSTSGNAFYGCTPEQIASGECTGGAGKPCGDNNTGVETAIGCIPTDPTALTKTILRLATGVAGGIAFLLMIFGAFQMITSSGNPEALKAGQDRFSSAIIGLLFIIFSVLILKIIGVDILGLQAFGI